MKNISTKKFVIAGLATLFTVGTASAADRIKIFKMAESGITIEFPMTPEEIAADDAANSILKATGRMNVTKPNARVKVFEMGEGGHRVVFPMTAEEITAADAENARLAAIRAANAAKPKNRGEVLEMAESGDTIEFPLTPKGRVADNSVIAGEVFDNEDHNI